MADLNLMLNDVFKESTKVKDDLVNFLKNYERLHYEANKVYLNEKLAAGSTEGLEEFHKLVQVIRRNRDVVGSVMKGFSNIKSVEKYKFIEEDIEPKRAESSAQIRRKRGRPSKKDSNKSESIIKKGPEVLNEG